MVNIMRICKISPEDLMRWRVASADKELVENGFAGMSTDEARRAILVSYKVFGDIIAEYCPEEDVTDIILSPIDGSLNRIVIEYV